jgi:CRP-like cAMP-binding protein
MARTTGNVKMKTTAEDAFFDVIRRLSPVSRDVFQKLAAISAPRSFAPGAFLLRAGERAVWSHFVVSGLVRELYVTPEGKEHTRTFVAGGQFTGSLCDLLSDRPSITLIEALEPTETLTWRYAEGDALCDRHPALAQVARRQAELLYLRKVQREYEMLALPAAARYRAWLDKSPGLDARISRRHLASFLGVTPEHLSRLRRCRDVTA